MDIPVRHTLRPVYQLPMQEDQSWIGCSIAARRQMVQINSSTHFGFLPIEKSVFHLCESVAKSAFGQLLKRVNGVEWHRQTQS
ncbi:MAG: hypothetical protein JWM11_3539 [Planctomycetaceae bacterium]|nr:hypothetical protein [Planctomycetaceae bacterium]